MSWKIIEEIKSVIYMRDYNDSDSDELERLKSNLEDIISRFENENTEYVLMFTKPFKDGNIFPRSMESSEVVRVDGNKKNMIERSGGVFAVISETRK